MSDQPSPPDPPDGDNSSPHESPIRVNPAPSPSRSVDRHDSPMPDPHDEEESTPSPVNNGFNMHSPYTGDAPYDVPSHPSTGTMLMKSDEKGNIGQWKCQANGQLRRMDLDERADQLSSPVAPWAPSDDGSSPEARGMSKPYGTQLLETIRKRAFERCKRQDERRRQIPDELMDRDLTEEEILEREAEKASREERDRLLSMNLDEDEEDDQDEQPTPPLLPGVIDVLKAQSPDLASDDKGDDDEGQDEQEEDEGEDEDMDQDQEPENLRPLFTFEPFVDRPPPSATYPSALIPDSVSDDKVDDDEAQDRQEEVDEDIDRDQEPENLRPLSTFRPFVNLPPPSAAFLQENSAGPSNLRPNNSTVESDNVALDSSYAPAFSMAGSSPPIPDSILREEKWYKLEMSWNQQKFDLEIGSNDLVYDLRMRIQALTRVSPDRQKIMGLLKGTSIMSHTQDAVRFGKLNLRDKVTKFKMVGTPVAETVTDTARDIDPGTLDIVYRAMTSDMPRGSHGRTRTIEEDIRNRRQVQDMTRSVDVTLMHQPRPGKRLLVLDLDYTLVDSRPLLDGSLPVNECPRPFLHEFLTTVYQHYDIVIWSQTTWRWLETKLSELGVIGGQHPYEICFCLDIKHMFSVFTRDRDGETRKHQVKPLQYIWAKFPHWGPHNTLHIDDLSRNFAMNPNSGIKIRPYKDAGSGRSVNDRGYDRELLYLQTYLMTLAMTPDLDMSKVDHSKWRRK